ncbi:MAG: tRNA (adenosine(37)-N6)-dimethylallyltransferase MiaA [Candidatus Hydrothermales bacterium]
MEDKIKVFALIGHTASGKNELAFEIAKELGAKIILCDSKKVYKLMDIGTSKPTKEMRKEVDYFMIDLKYPNEYYSAGDYAKDAEKIILELAKKKERFFVVGGGTLYLKALFEEDFISLDSVSFELREKLKKEKTEKLYELLKKIDPQRAKKIGKNDRVRIERAIEIYEVTGEKPSEIYKKRKVEKKIVPYYFAIYWDNKERKKRISDRLDKMMKIGFLEEVENLLRNGYDLRYKSLDAHGYKELILYLTGKIRSLEEAMALTKKRIYEYTKRQLRFFRNYLKIKPIFYKMEEGNRNFIKEKLKRVLEEEIWKDF